MFKKLTILILYEQKNEWDKLSQPPNVAPSIILSELSHNCLFTAWHPDKRRVVALSVVTLFFTFFTLFLPYIALLSVFTSQMALLVFLPLFLSFTSPVTASRVTPSHRERKSSCSGGTREDRSINYFSRIEKILGCVRDWTGQAPALPIALCPSGKVVMLLKTDSFASMAEVLDAASKLCNQNGQYYRSFILWQSLPRYWCHDKTN